MRRFDYDDEDFKDEIDNFWPDDDAEYIDYETEAAFMEKGDIINMLQIDMVEYELNQRILSSALKFCASSWLWKFKTLKSKLKTVKYVYDNFADLLDRDKKTPLIIEDIEEEGLEEEEKK